MIDLKLFRKNTTYIKKKINEKDPLFPTENLFSLDQEVIEAKIKLDTLLQQSNELSEKAKHGLSNELREISKKLSKEIEIAREFHANKEAEFTNLYLRCPNVPADDLPVGGKEANKEIRAWGSKQNFNFPPVPHHILAEKNKWINFSKATKISKSGFALYENESVDLLYSLCLWMIKHNRSYGFKAVIPPYLANEKTLTGASNLPRFKEDLFVCEKDNLYLLPTAECALAGLYQDEILNEEELPLRLTSWTPCFRREAGGYGSQEKGLIRMHQFEKVELFTFCKPEDSELEHQRMLDCAESILQKLQLHYRVSLLATGDCSFASMKTFDLEVWLPGQNEYREIASISNCGDFQSRRCKTRFRSNATKTTSYTHTLNGSSLALSRLMVALIETYQNADGSINSKEIFKILETPH